MGKIPLPPELSSSLGSEKIDFSVKASRAYPIGGSIFMLIFGIFWTAFSSVFVFALFGPIFKGGEAHFELNGVPTVAGVDNLGSLIVPGIFVSIFLIVGIGILVLAIRSLRKKGGYFVGTSTRLVSFDDDNMRSVDWESFSGDIAVSGNNRKGSITLQLRTGRMASRKNRSDEYVPDKMYILGIPNVYEVEKLCRMRIKENDPTPVNDSQG
jgi:hypothetical protein